MSRVRINHSIAGERWSCVAGELIDESDPRYAEVLPLTRGIVADLIDDAPRVETAVRTAPENASVARGKRR